MTNLLFISYRRSDSVWATRSIHQALSLQFGEENVFIDLDDIPYGMSFSEKLERELGRCSALLAVIGPNWLVARDNVGNRRIDDPDDWVRQEIAMGLLRRIPVVPILVDGAEMPKKERLPDNLKLLSDSNAIVLNNNSFKSDVDRLIKSLDAQLIRFPNEREVKNISNRNVSIFKSINTVWMGITIISIVLLVNVGFNYLGSNENKTINNQFQDLRNKDSPFKPNDMVLAPWMADGCLYFATILKRNGENYTIAYNFSEQSEIDAEQLIPIQEKDNYKASDEVYFASDQSGSKWVYGRIIEERNNQFLAVPVAESTCNANPKYRWVSERELKIRK